MWPGHLRVVDRYLDHLSRSTSAIPAGLKKVGGGRASLTTLSAMDMPGVLIQVTKIDYALNIHCTTIN